ncbi:MAG: MarR family transcriptional regulator [Treponemataceae bacterium]|nr:MarR family transcriptional regulator [Treponemataceae bacterium]
MFDSMMNIPGITFGDIQPGPFLLGLLSAFDNRYQASADSFFKEITWKQFFAIICIRLCKEAPTLNKLAEVMGSSHQNVKQILIKLEKKGFVAMTTDREDKRKQRITLTKHCMDFCEQNESESIRMISQLFQGINNEQLMTTIQTILKMEKNLESL